MSSLVTISECQTASSSNSQIQNGSAPVASIPTTARSGRCPVKPPPRLRKRPGPPVPMIDIQGVQERTRARAETGNGISPSFCNSSDSNTQTSSDEDSQASNDNDIVKSNPAKRQRQESTVSNGSTYSLTNLYNCEDDSTSCRTSGVNTEKEKYIGFIQEYELVYHSSRVASAYELTTKKIFTAFFLSIEDYKKFMRIAARIELAKKFYPMDLFRKLKHMVIPEETRIVNGKKPNGVYLLVPIQTYSLATMAESQPVAMPESQAQPIVKQIVELVEFCHSVNLVFRDFKTKKFVFTDKEKTKIRLQTPMELTMLDSLDDDQLTSGDKLPVNFIAPEQLSRRNASYAALKADMWGLGILTFLLLTNKYPFTGENPTTYINNIKKRKFSIQLNPTDSEASRWFVYGLLNSTPSERPTASRAKYMHWMTMTPTEIENRLINVTMGKKNCHHVNFTDRHTMALSLSYPYWQKQHEEQALQVVPQQPITTNVLQQRQFMPLTKCIINHSNGAADPVFTDSPFSVANSLFMSRQQNPSISPVMSYSL